MFIFLSLSIYIEIQRHLLVFGPEYKDFGAVGLRVWKQSCGSYHNHAFGARIRL